MDVIIIGSGPAGYTSAIYTSRARLTTLLFQGITPGGQLTTTDHVENFPGFPDGISGVELCERMEEQAKKTGTEIISEEVQRIELSTYPYKVFTNKKEYETKSVIIATGAVAKRLTFPGSEEYWNRGISACAVCDGSLPIFRNKPIAVVGGGDTAMEEALYLTKYASKVYMIHRGSTFRASKIMQERAISHPKIEILWNTIVIKAEGKKTLSSIVVQTESNESILDINGLFYGIGHMPSTVWLNGQMETDDYGYLKVNEDTSTSFKGIFVAGDVSDKKYRQAITAAGKGCQAALEVEAFLT